jgi:hypothetical protein
MSYGSPSTIPTDQYASYSLNFTVDGASVTLVFNAGGPAGNSSTSDAAIQRVVDVLNADPNITFDSGESFYRALVDRTITAT